MRNRVNSIKVAGMTYPGFVKYLIGIYGTRVHVFTLFFINNNCWSYLLWCPVLKEAVCTGT